MGVTEVVLAVNYQPQVMLQALQSMEKQVHLLTVVLGSHAQTPCLIYIALSAVLCYL